MLQKLERFDSGSNYRFGDKLEKQSVKKSLFDLSHTVAGTYEKEGMIKLVTEWETLPTDEFEISVDSLFRFQPLTVPPYSRSRVFFYAFYSRYSDLWDNWNVFMSKGYTGSVNKTVPTLNLNGGGGNLAVPSDSMLASHQVPIGFTYAQVRDSHISALPMMMSFRVWRDYFCCRDEYIDDRVLFPDDDSRFRLGDDGTLLSAADNDLGFYFVNASSTSYTDIPPYNHFGSYLNDALARPGEGEKVFFTGMWHEWAQDYFTSAKPFQQRGEAQSLTLNVAPFLKSAGWSAKESDPYLWIRNRDSGYSANFPADEFAGDGEDFNSSSPTTRNPPFLAIGTSASDTQIKNFNDAMTDAILKSVKVDAGTAKLYVSDLRNLLINQLELEKLAHTDGSYAQFGITFFGEKSKNATDYRPVYIGGTTKPILFSQVLQTSATGTGTGDGSPLGAYAGHGIVGVNNGYLGKIHCDDYGLIQIYAVILPDTYYSQGLPKFLTRSVQEEFFLSGREKLGMQPILNKEIYATGNSDNDNALWAYQDSWDEYRYLNNRVFGSLADSSEIDYFAYTQSRKFDSLPNWGHEFSTTQGNVRGQFYTSTSAPICTFQTQVNVRAVRPLPYRPTVGQIIN